MNDMIEDKRKDVRLRQLADAHTHEIERVIRDFNERSNGKTGKEVMELHLERYVHLANLLNQQKRVLDSHLGNPVEPEMQFGEAVLLPTFGGGGLI